MNKYLVSLTASAEKELHRLPAKMVARLIPRIDTLAAVPRPPGCKKLKGGVKEWRIRVGDYRIVYEIDEYRENCRRDADRAPARSLPIVIQQESARGQRFYGTSQAVHDALLPEHEHRLE